MENDPLLSDLVADTDDEMSAVTFGTGFTGITEIETGPDGNLYVLTFDREADGQGSLYRIVPTGRSRSLLLVHSLCPSGHRSPPVTDESEAGAEEGAEDEVNENNDNNNEGEDQEENGNENE